MSREKKVAEVLEAEAQWTRAHLEGDVEAIDHLMHRDYTIISPGGRVVAVGRPRHPMWAEADDGTSPRATSTP